MFGAVTKQFGKELSFEIGKTREEIDLEKRQNAARGFGEAVQQPGFFTQIINSFGRGRTARLEQI